MAGDSTNKVQIQIYNNITKEDFLNNVYPLRVPVVLRGLDIGTCTNTWTVDYLCQHAGKKEVKIHVCQSAQMDFLSKNFIYNDFSVFFFLSSKLCLQEEKYYLRSLGDDPRKDVADIKKQYPSLCNDIILPDLFPQDHFTSSVFRIASKGTQLWTHYDIMDNFLIQISGLKRAVLFSPRNATDMYLAGNCGFIYLLLLCAS
ncbi:tRNA wybutosine-synthesizing protein 5-like [Saccoglossus kowalevskii]|uniref:tRNA wybutosine-synthesizing protein 5-like n=1 Tax=Saccoglossus kowalevskii TaxID=10224 RepID=A0ABM0M9V5_SACKO|nr:PREDICTED: tRNA wybutosine-synthesizing protein 5-like [Saccoglossus kowalevskii]